MDILTELRDNPTLLVLVSSSDYKGIILDNVRQLSHKKVCYVTLNKTFDSVRQLFANNNVPVNNITFVDAISKNFKTTTPNSKDGCFFVSTADNFSELGKAISNSVASGYDCLIIDPVNTLFIYKSIKQVATFTASLVNMAKAGKGYALFYGIKAEGQIDALGKVSIFVDRVVDFSK